ncbi:hypothetical protein IQ06DRAFT_55667 [Phaeosphaeriaceae sp. SRC1lsM3a]|nr:hypothetical protein IQ06DRAFT_55667 [Stagonospora sp. SRC1lsM3a]
MDEDDALPPPIRRSPRAQLERQTALHDALNRENHREETLHSSSRARSTPLQREQTLPQQAAHTEAPPSRATTRDNVPGVTEFSRHKFSHPFWEDLKPLALANSQSPAPLAPPVAPPVPRRSPARLRSFESNKRNKRIPAHLQRRTSLETIASVATTQSIASDEDDSDPPEASAPSPHFFTLEDDQSSTPVPSRPHSPDPSVHSSSVSSQHSAKPVIGPVISREPEPHSPKSLLHRMTHRKQSVSSNATDRLVIERKVSFDRTSHRSSLTDSSQSAQNAPPSASGLFNAERSRSGSSSEWSASNFDVSNLSEAEIKKCKKKGINPALFAEMKAARKGKWTSPIAGNTFL